MNNIKMITKKRGQLTVFIVIALLIVAIIGIFIFLQTRGKLGEISPSENPQEYIRKCARDAVTGAEDIINPRGGFEDPEKYLLYETEKVAWHCYSEGKKEICKNIHPILKAEIEKEIKRMTEDKINSCFNEVKKKLAKYGYKEEEMNYSIEIVSKEIKINIKKRISFTKNEQQVNIENFNTKINSPLYDFIVIANKIVNEEIDCNCGEEACNADIIKLNRYNPDYEITRFVTSRNEDVYTIKEIISGNKFRLALRNCITI